MPVTDTECLRTQPVPQEKVLDQLLKDFGQAWFDGAKSVVDPRFNDGHDRLPLWTNKLSDTAEPMLNSRPVKVNNSGFDLSPVDMLLSHNLKKGNTAEKGNEGLQEARKG